MRSGWIILTIVSASVSIVYRERCRTTHRERHAEDRRGVAHTVRDLVVLDVVYLDWSWSPQTNKQTKQKWSEPASVEHNRACMHERESVCVCVSLRTMLVERCREQAIALRVKREARDALLVIGDGVHTDAAREQVPHLHVRTTGRHERRAVGIRQQRLELVGVIHREDARVGAQVPADDLVIVAAREPDVGRRWAANQRAHVVLVARERHDVLLARNVPHTHGLVGAAREQLGIGAELECIDRAAERNESVSQSVSQPASAGHEWRARSLHTLCVLAACEAATSHRPGTSRRSGSSTAASASARKLTLSRSLACTSSSPAVASVFPSRRNVTARTFSRALVMALRSLLERFS